MSDVRSATDPIGLVRELVDDARTRADRTVRSLRNGLRMYARLDRPPIASTPKDVVWSRDKVELWRYRSDRRRGGPPLVIVHSLVNRSYIFDLVPGNSMVEALLERGLDVYLIDWGVPDAADAENSLETYCDDYLPEIVRTAVATSGAESANVLGYCFGGVLALLYAAGHTDDPISSLITLATPVDQSKLPTQLRFTGETGFDPDIVIDETGNAPGSVIGEAIRSLAPTAELSSYVNLASKLWDEDYVAAHTAMDTWSNDEVPFAGEAFRQSARMLGERNGFVNDLLEMGGERRSLADITVPFLNVYGEKDHIVPADATRPLSNLVGSEDVTDLALDAGHVGLFIGRRAHQHGVPAMVDWIDARS